VLSRKGRDLPRGTNKVGPAEGGNPRDLSGHGKNATGGYSPLETIEEGMPWTQYMADVVSAREFKEKGEEKEVNEKPAAFLRIGECAVELTGNRWRIVITCPIAVGFKQGGREGKGLSCPAHTH